MSIINSESGDTPYQLLLIGLFIGVLYIAMPGMFHNFFNYIIDFFFDALHTGFGTDPDAKFGSGKKGNAEDPIWDGITLPGSEPKSNK